MNECLLLWSETYHLANKLSISKPYQALFDLLAPSFPRHNLSSLILGPSKNRAPQIPLAHMKIIGLIFVGPLISFWAGKIYCKMREALEVVCSRKTGPFIMRKFC